MSGPVIIRLQNLPLEARSIDIRRFFEGLSIPDGGVHIIGGDKGDAFIAFHSDEDARQAMAKDNQYLCNARIKLYLSSKTEMQNVISAARNQPAAVTPAAICKPQTHVNTVVNNLNPYSQQPQVPQQPQNSSNDLLSSLTKLISLPTHQQQQQQPLQHQQQSNILDQLKNIFPSTTQSMPINNNNNNNQYLPNKSLLTAAATNTAASNAASGNLPPILADILSKNSSSTTASSSSNTANNSNYYSSTISQPTTTAANSASSVTANPLLNQININQLLSLLSNTIASTPTPASSAATGVINQTSNVPSMQTTVTPTQQYSQQQQQQPQQQQQQYYQQPASTNTGGVGQGNGGLYNNNTAKYYPAQSYKQDQSTSNNNNRSLNDNFNNNNNNNKPSYNNNNNNNGNNRQQYNNNDRNNNDNYNRNGGGNKRQFSNDGQYMDNFNENKRNNNYPRDNDNDTRRPKASNSPSSTRPSGSNSSTHLDPIIRVRNFNHNCSYKDIRTFLQGIQIEHDGIKLITDTNGNRTGMAYVKLCTIIDLKKALCRNGQFYETRTIEVVQSTQHEFFSIDNFYQKKYQENNNGGGANRPYNNNNNNNYGQSRRNEHLNEQSDEFYDEINDNNNKNEEEYQVTSGTGEDGRSPSDQRNYNNDGEARGGYYLKIFGLPTRFDRHSLQNEFNNVRFMRIQTIFKHELGKPMLISEVETRLDLERALTRHDEKVIRQKIQVYEMTRAEFEQELNVYYSNRNNRNKERGRYDNEGEGGEDTTEDVDEYCDIVPPEEQDPNDLCIFMSGVPFSARNADVKFFFQNMNLLTIYLLQDPQTQKASGECCCMFKSKEDCARALTEKDNQLFRNRVVKIKPINYAEYQAHIINRKKTQPIRRFNNRSALQQTSNNNNNNVDDRQMEGNNNIHNKRYHDDDDDNTNNNDNNMNDDDNDDQNDYDDRNENNNNNNNDDQNDYNNGNDGNDDYNNRRNNNRYNNNMNNNNNNNYRQKFSSNRGNFNNNNNNNRNNNQNNGFKRRANTSPHDYNQQDSKRTRSNAELPPLPPELVGIENLVLLRNVSHKATRDDIIDMLRAYNAVEHTLKIRQYDTGKPTGEAIVAFNSRDDVLNFLQQMNGTSYMGRPLRITEVN